jgi:4-amino-4-deoxy-L-arabinose transferase-like glycosyltransferase
MIEQLSKHRFAVEVPFLIVLSTLTLRSLLGVEEIPYHPDESTYIYMSSDFEKLLTDPTGLIYDPATNQIEQHYRLIDAPIPRYIIGFGRSIAGLPASNADWDWGKSWKENQESGALPSDQSLLISRLSITILLPISLILIYLTGNSISDRLTSLLALLFFGTSALILLHGRRAMAEGAVVFGVSLFLWSLIKGTRYPWFAGLAMALAFSAKQSTLALLPVGLLAMVWPPDPLRLNFKKIGANIAQYLGIFAFLAIALNPVFWASPLQTIRIAINERQDLLYRQVRDTQELAPEKVMDTPGERVVAVLANIYVAPLMFFEIGNYVPDTRASVERYLSFPGNNLFRGLAGGGVLLFLTLLGLVSMITQYRTFNEMRKRGIVLFLCSFIFQLAGLIIMVPLLWQRYVMPLMPFVFLLAAYGFRQIINTLEKIGCSLMRTDGQRNTF